MKLRLFKLALPIFMMSVSALGAVFELKNEKLQLQIDDKGNLVSLKNLVQDREYAGGEGLWRIIYQDGLSYEESLESEQVDVSVKKVGEKLMLSYGGEFPVKVECTLKGDEVHFSPEIKNASKDKILREFQFPMIKSAKIKKDTTLYWSYANGTFYKDIRGWLIGGGFKSYMAQDNKAIEQYEVYPSPLTMNYYVLDDKTCSLYFANHDAEFEKTLHLVRARKNGGKGDFSYCGIDFAMAKYPFLKSGESKKFADFVISAHAGDWHVSAKKYRKWAENSWYKHVPIPNDFKKSNGWQRIILRHQYGSVLYRYDQLPEIRKAGKEAGLDSLLLFGWWKEGMDAGYPDYSPDDTQGGDEALKKWIKEFQKDGGKVNLYFNGQLIDMSTKFYREKGCKLSIKRADGTEHIERYPFGGDGTALRVFGNKTFVTACPACDEWLDVLKGFADRAIALGCDGVFYDQLGLKSELCYDASHGHAVPAQNVMKYKSEMVRKLREYVRAKKPEMSMGIEWICDPVSMYSDYTHGVYPNLHLTGGRNTAGGAPRTAHAPMFQYTFPEVYTTNRDIYNNQDIPRRMNLTFMRGWREDAAVYRCRATVDEAPVYKEYLTKINKLRDEFRSETLNSILRDTELAVCSNSNIEYQTFETDDKITVVATQSFKDKMVGEFVVAGAESLIKTGGLGDYKITGDKNKISVELAKDALLVLVFKKK